MPYERRSSERHRLWRTGGALWSPPALGRLTSWRSRATTALNPAGIGPGKHHCNVVRSPGLDCQVDEGPALFVGVAAPQQYVGSLLVADKVGETVVHRTRQSPCISLKCSTSTPGLENAPPSAWVRMWCRSSVTCSAGVGAGRRWDAERMVPGDCREFPFAIEIRATVADVRNEQVVPGVYAAVTAVAIVESPGSVRLWWRDGVLYASVVPLDVVDDVFGDGRIHPHVPLSEVQCELGERGQRQAARDTARPRAANPIRNDHDVRVLGKPARQFSS